MARKLRVEYAGAIYHLMNRGDRRESIFTKRTKKVSVNGIAIFLLEAQDAAWLASYQWNIRARFITS